ncbi:LysR family transcriptional regulator [Bradyrhizobium oligotrophicum]|uniref:LysR family transcriptional regulator n=1 Tax=Bradyrhizobium oligotrophicum TaxID=44255 RepID=UPI003EC07169
MDWDDIRFFLSVARAGQFSSAAVRMGVDMATIARRINSLEKSLKVRLFDRLRTGCVLTQAGERFLPTAEALESQLLQAQGEISGSDVEVSGTVRIASPDGFGTLFLCSRVGTLKAKFPSLTIQLVPITRALSLSKREADLAVTVDRPSEGRLVARKLVDYSLHLYASTGYISAHGVPGSLEELSRHCLVTYVPDLIFDDQLRFMPEIFGPMFSRLECSTAVGQLEAVRSGAGIGILHDYAAYQDSRLEIVLPEVRFDRTYWIVTHADLQGLARVRAAVDHLVLQVKENKHIFKRQ